MKWVQSNSIGHDLTYPSMR